jgi:DNA polymerase III subunit delta'
MRDKGIHSDGTRKLEKHNLDRMTFDQLDMHQEIQWALKEGLSNGRVPHAQYFMGVDGGGHLPMAVAYAQALLNDNPSDLYGQGDTRAARLEHPDLHIVFPVVQSASQKTCERSINEFREAYQANPYMSYKQWQESRGEEQKKAIISKSEAEAIAKRLSLKSYEGGRKVLLLWMPELMNDTCANKLLKLIEEPPDDTVILLVGTDKDALLPTIQSRIQEVPFRPLSSEEIFNVLSVYRAEEEAWLMEVAEQAEGSLAYAISLLTEGIEDQSPLIIEWMRLCYARRVPEIMAWCDDRVKEGREPTLRMLEGCLDIFRMALRRNFIQESLASDKEVDTFTQKFSPYIHVGNAEGLMEAVEKAHADISRFGNARIVLLDLSFQVIRLLRMPVTQN